jgi:hypothetical protein
MPIQQTNKYVAEEEEEDEEEEQEYVPEDDEEDDDEEEEEDDEEDDDDIKAHVMRLEKQVMALTEMFMKQTKNHKSVFSLFA